MRKSPKTTPAKEVKFSLRVPEETYDVLRQISESEKRSINSQVVLVLEEWITHHTIGYAATSN
jgi:hypothetical protein